MNEWPSLTELTEFETAVCTGDGTRLETSRPKGMTFDRPQCEKCGQFIPYERATRNGKLEGPPCVGWVEWWEGLCKNCEQTNGEQSMLSKPIPTNLELTQLLAKAKGYVMSPAEYVAQRKSWTKGQVTLANPNMTEERFEEIWASLPENVTTTTEQS